MMNETNLELKFIAQVGPGQACQVLALDSQVKCQDWQVQVKSQVLNFKCTEQVIMHFIQNSMQE